MKKTPAPRSTLDPVEQAHFATLGGEWWKNDGELAGLKAYNPVRVAFILEAVASARGKALPGKTPLKGLKVLDIGCGGGLLAEELAKLGAQVTGLDATPAAIAAAQHHASLSGLKIDYRVATIEEFTPRHSYDLVVVSEVLEHVADAGSFLAHAADYVGSHGVLVVTTLNRTLRSLALGIVVAEHLLKLAPKGTHNWKKFFKPSEVAALLEQNGLTLGDVQGAVYNPLTGQMRASPTDLSVNYMLWASRI